MPTLRTPLKRRRLGPQAEAMAWADTFDTSFDFFDELAPLGIVHPVDVWPPEARHWGGFRAQAESAWHRLGAIHMAQRDPKADRPWALDQFGEP